MNHFLVKEVISNINSSQVEIHISFSDTLSMIAGANITFQKAFIGEDYIMEFNNNFKLLNTSIQKVIILHELLHLKLYAMLKDRNFSNYGEVLPNFNQYYYNCNQSFNDASHEFFAVNYLGEIANIISLLLDGLEIDKIKWSSLTETEEFKNLPANQQENIINYLIINGFYL